MNRVVCCYHALVAAAAEHARRYLVIALPVDRWWIRWGVTARNAMLALRRDTFRGYVHATRAVIAAAERRAMRLTERRRGLIWQLVVLERADTQRRLPSERRSL